MNKPLVSVIVTTKNNHSTLQACLASIRNQSYEDCELIVVDNASTDDTKTIARQYTEYVYDKGPERSAQRNYAVEKAKGQYVVIIDSDMELDPKVVEACVSKVQDQNDIKAVIIPEESFGEGFWARCKRLERSYYVGVDSIESARFFDKKLYVELGGYDEKMTGGEDWDLTGRIRERTTVAHIDEYIMHNEGHPHFMRTAKKMYYYGQHAAEYFSKNPTKSALTNQSGPIERYKLFLSRPGKLLKQPLVGAGMLTLKTTEYAAGGLGMTLSRYRQRRIDTERVNG